MSSKTRASIITLFVLVFISLGLNVYLITQWLQVQRQAQALGRQVKPLVQESLREAVTELETFQNSTIELNVRIQQDFPVRTEIPFEQTLEIPIKMEFPIKEQIQTTVMMDPFQSGLEIPVDINVPVDMEVPIDTVVPVTLNQPIPISATVPVDIDFPIAIEVNETELAGYADRLRERLIELAQTLDELLPAE